ncbi:MAG: signal peptidase I [Treponema sp.]
MSGKRTDNFLFLLIAGAAAGLLIKLFALDVLRISGSSMEPALKNGSFAAVNKLAYGLAVPFNGRFFAQWAAPKAGDAVIYLHNDKIVVKRCIAVSGAPLDFLSEPEYSLTVNGKKIPLTKVQYEGLSPFSEVPEGYALMLGDNLGQSIDSRDYGFVSVKNITGKIIGK